MAHGSSAKKRAERNARKRLEQQRLSVAAGGAAAPTVCGEGVASTHQSDAPLAVQQSDMTSPWWRELSPEQVEKARAMGLGGAVDLMRERWLELRAVNEHWPISREVRERMVYESLTVMLDQKADPRLRQRERWLLQKMADSNRVKGLPEQIDPQTAVGGVQSVTINIGEMVRELLEQPGVLDAIDFRPFKPERGGPDDYAE